MSIQSYSVFVAIAQAGSLTRAADALHLTQPAVGLQLKKLEERCNTRLFDRTAQGMRLTVDGAQLLPLAEKVLASHRSFKMAASQMSQELRGSLAITTILDPEFLRLGAWLRELLTGENRLQVSFRHGMSGDSLAQVMRAESDAGFYLSPPPDKGSLANLAATLPGLSACLIKPLTRFTYRVLAPAGWAQQVQDAGWNDLARLPWIATPPASVHSRLLSQVFGPDSLTGLDMNAVALVDQEATMLDLVRSGVGLSLARDHIAIRAAQAQGLAIAANVQLECMMSFICLRERTDDPVILAVLSALDKVWPDSSPTLLDEAPVSV